MFFITAYLKYSLDIIHPLKVYNSVIFDIFSFPTITIMNIFEYFHHS